MERITKYWFKILSISLTVLIVIVFLLVLKNYQALEETITVLVFNYGLTSIFLISFAVDAMFQPIGPDLALILGHLAGLDVAYVFAATISGSILASLAGYAVGTIFSEDVFIRFYGKNNYEKWKKFYYKYGRSAVAIAALTPLPYVPFCWISGIFQMKKIDFVLYAIIPRTVRFMIIAVGLIYFF